MRYALGFFGSQGTPFNPVTHTYYGSSVNVAGNETIPSGANFLKITMLGGGGGGSASLDGVPGGLCIKNSFALSSSDWGVTLAYVAGKYGAGGSSHGLAAGNTTLSGTLAIGPINMAANGGSSTSAGYPGTASGGDINTAGGANNGGGAGDLGPPIINGSDGGVGSLKFEYT